ncbi:lysophospholipid acyltransferase family protein [Shewanella waksmanii]|uniref:lysophospholipid acyltransferase family protein n=1 Tax=Shewanella waksmanii TaxID=213783 RepID=UPI00373660F3
MTEMPVAPTLRGIRYIPRWLGGVSCYIVFGLGGLLSSLTILPVLRFWPGSRQQRIRRVRAAVSAMFRFFVAMLTWAGVLKLYANNAAKLNETDGQVIIANHPTLIDVVVLISLMPNVGCIVKQGLWRNPFLRGVVASAGYIPNRGAELLLQDCQQVLDTGTNLIIFPEGTRTLKDNVINPFARGAANIALRTKTDITPVVLRTNAIGLTKQQAWYQIPRQTIGMRVEVGTRFAHHGYDADNQGQAKAARTLTRDLEHYYRQQLDKNL